MPLLLPPIQKAMQSAFGLDELTSTRGVVFLFYFSFNDECNFLLILMLLNNLKHLSTLLCLIHLCVCVSLLTMQFKTLCISFILARMCSAPFSSSWPWSYCELSTIWHRDSASSHWARLHSNKSKTNRRRTNTHVVARVFCCCCGRPFLHLFIISCACVCNIYTLKAFVYSSQTSVLLIKKRFFLLEQQQQQQ